MDFYEKRIRARAKKLKHEKELITTDYDSIMEKARKTRADRDKMDLESGFDNPGETRLSSHIETAMAAIEAHISNLLTWQRKPNCDYADHGLTTVLSPPA